MADVLQYFPYRRGCLGCCGCDTIANEPANAGEMTPTYSSIAINGASVVLCNKNDIMYQTLQALQKQGYVLQTIREEGDNVTLLVIKTKWYSSYTFSYEATT